MLLHSFIHIVLFGLAIFKQIATPYRYRTNPGVCLRIEDMFAFIFSTLGSFCRKEFDSYESTGSHNKWEHHSSKSHYPNLQAHFWINIQPKGLWN